MIIIAATAKELLEKLNDKEMTQLKWAENLNRNTNKAIYMPDICNR